MASKNAPAAEPDPSLVLRWKGDESIYVDGIPNRDITTADVHLSPDDLARAVEYGTHEKVS